MRTMRRNPTNLTRARESLGHGRVRSCMCVQLGQRDAYAMMGSILHCVRQPDNIGAAHAPAPTCMILANIR
jgi:hypothetical protein|eukprot:COSAG01_NODE_806_length_13438_cov_1217.428143_8_plen_71_part_00